jgi:hypothetical protein
VERTERFLAIFLALLLYAIWPETTRFDLNLAELILVALGVLSAVTVAQRVHFAYKKL